MGLLLILRKSSIISLVTRGKQSEYFLLFLNNNSHKNDEITDVNTFTFH